MKKNSFFMTGCLILLFSFLFQHSVTAQTPEKRPAVPVICPAKLEDMHTRVNIPDINSKEFQRTLQNAATAEFEITFGPGAQANPDAQEAFQFALDIWSTQIVSSVPIKIYADFASLGPGVLASAGPAYNVVNFPGAPEPDVLYPAALANALAGEVLFPDEEYDLIVNLGDGIPWYYGTDGNTPSGLYDFVTVALHEAAHGLGFTTVRSYSGGIGSLRSNGLPAVFGLFIVDGDGTYLLTYPDPSVELGDAFTSGDLFMDGDFAKAALGGERPELYAPSTFQGGSSIAHWDEAAFPAGDPNSLMTPQVGSAESNHDIGDITRGLFKDMGWLINDAEAPPLVASPTSLTEELSVGDSITETITVSNISDASITATISASPGSSTIETISPEQLTIPSAGSDSFNVTLNSAGLTKGIYQDTIFVQPVDTDALLSIPVTVRVIDGTEVPIISVSPEMFNETVEQFQIVTRDLTISNTGDDNLSFSISVNDNSTPSFTERVQTSTQSIMSQGFSNMKYSHSFESGSLESLVKSNNNSYNKIITSLYATDFEDFSIGDIDGQSGWISQYLNNWVVSDENPLEGTLHFRGISDGLGDTRPGNILAISPTVAPGDEPFMVMSASVNIQGTGVTWEVIPQSPSAGSVNTRLRFNGDGTIDVLSGSSFNRIEATTPEGYFDLRIVVDKDDSAFTIYFDGELIYSGQGFAPEIEQVVFLSFMEVEGSTMDVDNLEITDGDPDAFFLSVSPSAGNVAFGSSTTVQVKFDARTLDPGDYSATISINSNDPVNSLVEVPVSLTVVQPPTIEVSPDSLSAAVNVQTDIPPVKTETFTITNSGQSPLEFNTSFSATRFTPDLAVSDIPVESLDMANYGAGNINILKDKPAGLSKDKLKTKIDYYQNESVTFSDSIYYDSGILFPDDFSGVQTAPYTSALNFDVESDFTLTAVRNGYRTEAVTSPVIILEIYKGGSTPNDGELLLSQTSTLASEEGVVAVETLNEALSFSAGESFWVVHKYPDGIAFPQGVDSNATQRPDTYFFSSDGGSTYNPSGFVFFVRALSGGSGNYITLEPSSGTVNPGESINVSATFNGEELANGTYETDIIISSNDPANPTTAVATTFEVSGQVSEIEVSEEFLLFNNVFLGGSKELSVTISNNGLAQLSISGITSDNPDFTVDTSSAVIEAGESLELEITFTPSQLGSINGIITIESDASNNNLIEIIVNGVGVDPPVAVLDPTEVSETTDAGTTIDSQITLINEGNSPLIFSFPDLAVAAALANPEVKLNNTERITFENFKLNQEKGYNDTRIGSPVLYSVGTDNGYGYKWIDSDEPGGPVYNFNDISSTGTEITSLINGDGTTEVAISFPFEFYGNQYSSAFVNANGFIAFQAPTTTTTWVNTQLPNDDSIDNIIAGLWEDLEPQNFNGAVYYQDFGNHFIVQWSQASDFLGSETETVTFQIVLYEDGNIDIFYEDVETAPFINTATVGIENADGTDGAQVAFNTSYLKNGLAVRFVKPAFGLTPLISNVSPLSGVVAAGKSKSLTVTLDATSLTDGVYYDELAVSSNDPVNVPTTLFELTVIGYPEISITPDSLAFDPIFIGLSSEATFLIENLGTKTLEISGISNENSDFSLDTTSAFSLEPGTTQIISVLFSPTTVGLIEDSISITSNDAFGNETYNIPLSGVGIDPPVLEVSPDSVSLSLVKGDSATETVSISNTGNSTLNYSLSPPFFAKAGEKNKTPLQYPKIEYAKIEHKESPDTRIGPQFMNASGGPGTFGYTWVDNNSGGPAYDYIDITSMGQTANVGGDGNESIPLSFDFNFFGEVQDSITISANGYVTFATITGTDFVNEQIPDEANPNLFIAGMWDDLEPQNGDGVFYYGTDEYFIIQYENVPGWGLPPFIPIPDPVSFQIILFPDGSIKMQYKNVDSTIRTSSTVGIEGPLGLSGLQVIFNTEYLTDGLAITFTPPVTGTAEPGETVEVPVTFSTEALEEEEIYTGDIIISSNDPANPQEIIPVSLEVLKAPQITGFTLIDAFSNKEVGALNDADRIDLDDYRFNAFSIVASTDSTNVGSVVFDFNDSEGFKIENAAPYALNGDYFWGRKFHPVKFPVGINTVTATPYTGSDGTGIAGTPLTITFEVFRTNTTEVVSFTLIDANTNKEVGILNNGDVIDIAMFRSNKFSVVANTGSIKVSSVVFDFNDIEGFKTENDAPYSLNGDYRKWRWTKYYPVEFSTGTNTITATPYSRKYGKGEPGVSLSISFEVIDSNNTLAKTEYTSKTILNEPGTLNQNVIFSPNPVKDYAELSFQSTHSTLNAFIYDFNGRLMFNEMITVENNNTKKQIDMTKFASGVYILSLINNEGKSISRLKIVKE
ncbi:Ig-like domain-containing protein [Abyssalbus ytuae]|uniref:Choice-of-anchor D domain-containing protein n=1 Tax=Abyssalbus ytuae TaxID=2926907 RepID=A0A9E6ZK34_9FLAO|nr:choice-of-anchor D domain-containing protein [Abyssalbus ytuae]UOB17099.1 choice-of-anchor D domain-containing protein [Abyssalbus ytuae]